MHDAVITVLMTGSHVTAIPGESDFRLRHCSEQMETSEKAKVELLGEPMLLEHFRQDSEAKQVASSTRERSKFGELQR